MILVLQPDPAHVADVQSEVEALGWTCESSIGEEQAVLSLSGSGDVAALEAALSRRTDVDLVPLLSGKEYGRMRARRRFMSGVASGLGLLAAGGMALPIVGFLMPPKKDLLTPNIVRAARTDEIAENEAKVVRLLGEPVLLVHQGDQRYFALSAVCTHMRVCQLEWSGERQQLICPCHGGAFDVHGNVVQGPPSIPLPAYDVERVGGEIFVRRKG